MTRENSTEFKDKNDESWSLALDIGLARGLKTEFDFDVTKLDGAIVEQVFADPFTIADMLRFICQSQMDSRGVDSKEFFNRLDEGAIDNASTALLQAIANFSPKLVRQAAKIFVEKVTSVLTEVSNEAAERAGDLEVGGKSSIKAQFDSALTQQD